MAILDDEGLLYETTATGQRILVKSINSDVRTYLRFTNCTNRPVNVFWRDFQGIQRFYANIGPDSFYDVNSYLTHPWEFQDASTNEYYLVNSKIVFRAPENTGGMMYRTNWNISIGMRSLRDTAMLAIGTKLRDVAHIPSLQLPRPLERELKDLVEKLLRVEDGRTFHTSLSSPKLSN